MTEAENESTAPPHDEERSLSLDDLGAAYAQAFAEHDPTSFADVVSQDRLTASGEQKQAPEQSAGPEEPETCEHDAHVSPIGIIEAALFVGHPSNQPLSDVRLASLMRDVTPEEVNAMIQELNASYRRHHQALRITRVEGGYCMTVAPEVDGIRHAFLGKVREARLNQSAVEVLALVAYQPGITAQKVQDQRGHDSAAALNQLVRRGLVEVRRSPESGQKSVAQYHPTERFLALFGLETLSDLPHVEDT